MRPTRYIPCLALVLGALFAPTPARATGGDPFVAEICIFPFNFAPQGWTWCDGQLLPLSQNTALFSLLGTTYGGNGKSNFALPDLQGRTPVMHGQGPGLTQRDLGAPFGSEVLTLLAPTTLPIFGTTANGRTYPVTLKGGPPMVVRSNLPPYLTFYFNISLQGIFPPRG